MQTGNTDFIYKNELDKACFQRDMAYGKSKDLIKRTQPGKLLKERAFKITSNPKYNVYQRGLASMVYKFFDKKSKGSGIVTNKPIINQQINFINQILENLKKEKFIHHFQIIFGVFVQLICNH